MEENTNFMNDVEIVREFLAESNDHMDDVEAKILELEKNPEDVDVINSIFRPIHSMKGSAGFLGMKDIGKVSHELETLLDEARKLKIKLTPEIIEILYGGVDVLKKLRETIAKKLENKDAPVDVIDYQPLLSEISAILRQNQNQAQPEDTQASSPKDKYIGEILLETDDISKDQLEIALQEQAHGKRLGEILVEKGITTQERVEKALRTQSMVGKPSSDTVKVDTQKLDNLVNLIGELVIANALIRDTLGSNNNGVNKNLTHLNKIIKDIQDQVMCMRMVPLK